MEPDDPADGRRVVVSEYPMIDPAVYREVLPADVTVEVAELGSAERLVEAAAGAEAVVTDVRTPVTAEALDRLELRAVIRSATGVDNVDVEAAAERGVVVTNVPGYATDEVATHAVGLLLAGVRSIPAYAEAVRDGRWSWEDGRPIRRFRDRTVGLVSFGPIARRAAEQLSGFGVDLLAHDPYVDAGTFAEHGVESAGLEGLFDRSDHVSVHAPLTPETRGMVGADLLGRLDPESVLVNTGRGGVVDEEALLAALEADRIKFAALDVLAEEPPGDDPLVGRPDTLVTPHAGWYSEDAREEVNRRAAADLRRVLAGEEPVERIDPDLDWL